MEHQVSGQARKPAQQTDTQLRPASPLGARTSSVLQPNPTVGNRVLGRLIQAKLKIGPSGDQYEREADRVAEQVMRMPEASIPDVSVTDDKQPPRIQRVCSECEEEEVQRQTEDEEELSMSSQGGSGPRTSTPAIETSINNLKGTGQPLPASERAYFEQRFKQDFSPVQIHTGGAASETAKDLNALAYTVGHDIAFAAGQYSPGTQAGRRLLAHELTHVVQQGHSSPLPDGIIQRQTNSDRETTPTAEAQNEGMAVGGARPSLIVEDDARQVESGQMRRSEFLARLKEDVCRESDDAMRGTGQSTEGCPYVERWFDYYTDKPASHIERALRRYAPEAASATSAGDYIRAASARVRRSVEVWATTGEVTGVPDELASVVMGGAILGAIGGVIGGIASAIGGVVSGIGKAITGLGRLLFKGKEGGARQGAEAGQVSESLNGGERLEGGVRQRMEGAFGRDFSGVRVHRDGRAGEVAEGMNARALTVGQEVVFGSGEYRPGTMVGDALIAHELAHVVQQSGTDTRGSVMQKGEDGMSGLEEDADIAAAHAVVSIWGGADRRLAGMAERAMPSLRSGLRLQRCSGPKTPGPNYESCSKDQVDKVNDAYSLAQGWMTNTLAKVDAVLENRADQRTLDLLNVHFNIKDPVNSKDQIINLRKGLVIIQSALGGPVPFECEPGKVDKSLGAGGCSEGGRRIASVNYWPIFGFTGGVHLWPAFFDDEVMGDDPPGTNTPPVIIKQAREERATTIIHEMAHKFGGKGEGPYFGGCGDDPTKYASTPTKDALGFADPYAQFVRQLNR